MTSKRSDRSYVVRGNAKWAFVRMLASDLRAVGFAAKVRRSGLACRFRSDVLNSSLTIGQGVLDSIRARQLDEKRDFIEKAEAQGVVELFVDGCELRIDNIKPRIQICRTHSDYMVFKYARLLQSVPSAERVGRQISALVLDEGQDPPKLMGVIGLASSAYTIACRDKYLHWSGPKVKDVKDLGLRRIMDLSLCLSLPPYSYLLGGKLVAALSLSSPLSEEFERKYGDPLLGVVATCATGLHCPIFNRIMIRPGGLFKRVGETAGFTTIIYRRETIAAAREILFRSGAIDRDNWLLRAKSIRILRTALEACGVPADPFLQLGNAKGVYLGCVSSAAVDLLRNGGKRQSIEKLALDEIYEFWRDRILPKRSNNPHYVRRVKNARRSQIRLTRQIQLR